MQYNTIKFYQGEENGIIVEQDAYRESIFFDQYSQALHILNGIVGRCKPENEPIDENLAPNLVAFCGDRGEGKTSCMCSVRKMLMTKSHDVSIREFFSSIKADELTLPEMELECLPLINPAFFDHNHNIIELLLGQLYQEFKKMDSEQRISHEKSFSLCQKFQSTKCCLKHLDKTRREMYDLIEELDVLAAGVELRESIAELFKEYLDVKAKKFLIISVDDLDLNMNEAYVMSEQIRKYLCNPYCIVLISVKIDQLINVIENTISGELVPGSKMNVRDMAVKYVDKLLPMGIRVNMPKVYDLCNKPIEIFSDRQNGQKIGSYPSVRDCVVRLIFVKTRFLFYNSTGGVSPIVPNNLRALRHILGMLLDMPDFEDNFKTDNNKRIFKHYFFGAWIKNLSKEFQQIAVRLVHNNDLTQMNKLIIEVLTSALSSHSDLLGAASRPLTRNIVTPGNYGFNQSTGDVFHILGILERSSSNEDVQLLLFFIRSFYSILLYENYDAITENGHENLFPNLSGTGNGEVFKSDKWFNRTNLLQRLINGSYFSYFPAEMLHRSKEGNSRDLAIIRGDRLRELVRRVREMLLKPSSDEIENSPEFRSDFRLLEFFLLHIMRRVPDALSDVESDGYRRQPIPAHLQTFNYQIGYYLFDIVGSFSNIINLQFTYDRFENSQSFFEFAYAREWTLLGRMMKLVQLKEAREGDSSVRESDLPPIASDSDREKALFRLISNATLRNAEVISAMTESIKFRAEGIKSTGVRSLLMREFYSSIINSEMKTYQKNINESTQYIMRFGFLEAFRELLAEVNPDTFESFFTLSDQISQEDIIKTLFREVLGTIKKWRSGKYLKAQIMKNPKLYEQLSANAWDMLLDNDIKFTKEDLIECLRNRKEWTL